MAGHRLAKLPAMKEWSRVARNTPDVLGGGTGFAFYNFLTTDKDTNLDGVADAYDRLGQAMHGFLAGGFLSLAGKLSDKLEGAMLKRGLEAQMRGATTPQAAAELLRRMNTGTMPTLQEFKTVLGARAVGTAIEASGWAMIDEQFINALLSQDFSTAAELYAQSIPGALLARSGRVDMYREWRRVNPELNTMGLRRDLVVQRRRAEEESRPQDEPPPDDIQDAEFTVVDPKQLTEPVPTDQFSMRDARPLPERASGRQLPARTSEQQARIDKAEAEQQKLVDEFNAINQRLAKELRKKPKQENTVADQAERVAKLKQQQREHGQKMDKAESARAKLLAEVRADQERREGLGDLPIEGLGPEAVAEGRAKLAEEDFRQQGLRGGQRLITGPEYVPPLKSAQGQVVQGVPDTPLFSALKQYLQRRFEGLPDQPRDLAADIEFRDLNKPKQITFEEKQPGRPDVRREGGPPIEVPPRRDPEAEAKRPVEPKPDVASLQRLRSQPLSEQQQGEPPAARPAGVQQQEQMRRVAEVRDRYAYDQVSSLGNPLVRAGFELADGYPKPFMSGSVRVGDRIGLEFPGTPGVLELCTPDMNRVTEMRVPVAWYKAVRGVEVDTPYALMRDRHNMYDFVRDLAAVGQMRKMSEALHLGAGERTAGGMHSDGQGRVSSIGIDGKMVQQMLPLKPGRVNDTSYVGVTPSTGIPDRNFDAPHEPEGYTREMANSWIRFAGELRKTAPPTRSIDLIEAAVYTAAKGDPEAPAVHHMRRFLARMPYVMLGDPAADIMQPSQVEPALQELAKIVQPHEIDALAEVLGELGSGNLSQSNALDRMAEIIEADAGVAEFKQLIGDVVEMGSAAEPAGTPQQQKRLEEALQRYRELRQETPQDVGRTWSGQQKKAQQRAREEVQSARADIAESARLKQAVQISIIEGLTEDVGKLQKQGRPVSADVQAIMDAVASGQVEKQRRTAVDRELLRFVEDIAQVEMVDPGSRAGGPPIVSYAKIMAGQEPADVATAAMLQRFATEQEMAALKGRESGAKLNKGEVQELQAELLASGHTLNEQVYNLAPALDVPLGPGANKMPGLTVDTVGAALGLKKGPKLTAAVEALIANGVPVLPASVKGSRINDLEVLVRRFGFVAPEKTQKDAWEGGTAQKLKDVVQAMIDGQTVTSVSSADTPANNSTKKNVQRLEYVRLLENIANRVDELAKTEAGVEMMRQRVEELRDQLHGQEELSPNQRQELKRRLSHYLGDPVYGASPSKLQGETKAEIAEYWKRDKIAWDASKGKPQADDRAGERGNVLNPGDILSQIANSKIVDRAIALAAYFGSKIPAGLKSVYDVLYSSRYDGIRRLLPNHTISNDLMEIHSRRRRYGGEMDELIKPALPAMKNAAWRNELMDIPVPMQSALVAAGSRAGQPTSWEQVVPGVQGAQWARWRRVAEGLEPRKPDVDAKTGLVLDEVMYQASQDMLGYAYTKKQSAGGWIGDGFNAKPLGDIDRHYYPRKLGADFTKVMDKPMLRQKYFQVLEAMNPNLDWQRLEQAFLAKESENLTIGEVVPLDSRSAIERIRVVPEVPDLVTIDNVTYEMFSTDPQAVVFYTRRLQSGEIAATEVSGQDGTKATRDIVRKKASRVLQAPADLVTATQKLQAEQARQAGLPAKLQQAQQVLTKASADLSALQARQSNLMTASERAKFTADLNRAMKAHTAAIKRVSNFQQQIQNAVGRVGTAQQRVAQLSAQTDPRLQLLANQVIQNLNRGGLQAAATDAVRTLMATDNTGDTLAKTIVKKLIEEGVKLAQGTAIPRPGLINMGLRGVRSIDSVPRSIMAMYASVYDVTEYAALPFMFGTTGDAVTTWKGFLGSYQGASMRDKLEHYMRAGSVSSMMQKLLYEHSGGFTGKLANVFGKAGEITELGKGVLMSILADVQLARFKTGNAITADKQRMELLRLPLDMQHRLMTGKYTSADADRFRVDFVRLTTRRAEPGEGVPIADSLVAQSLFRFTRFITQHQELVKRTWSDALADRTPARAQKLARAFGVTTGLYGTTAAGFSGLGVLLHGLLSLDDGENIVREMMYGLTTPKGQVENLKRAFTGGGVSVALDALLAPTWEGAHRATAPGDIAASAIQLVQSLVVDGADWRDFTEAMRELHLVPMEADVVNRAVPRIQEWIIASVSGEKLSNMSDHIADRDAVYSFVRGPGRQTTLLGTEMPRDEFKSKKGREYYNIVNNGLKLWFRESAQYEGPVANPAEQWKRSLEYFQEAAELEDSSPSSVANWLRSRKHTKLLPNGNEDLYKLREYITSVEGGEEQFARIMAHDEMIEELAGYIGSRMRPPTMLLHEWNEQVEQLRFTAKTGGNVKPMVDEAVEWAAQRFESAYDAGVTPTQSSVMERIDPIAGIISRNKKAYMQVFKGTKWETAWRDQSEGANIALQMRMLVQQKLLAQAMGRFKNRQRSEVIEDELRQRRATGFEQESDRDQ
jgi:hypothetical protein